MHAFSVMLKGGGQLPLFPPWIRNMSLECYINVSAMHIQQLQDRYNVMYVCSIFLSESCCSGYMNQDGRNGEITGRSGGGGGGGGGGVYRKCKIGNQHPLFT